MFTEEDTFNKLADPTFHLEVWFNDLEQELFDKIIYDYDMVSLEEPDFVDDDGFMHYYQCSIADLIDEVYQIAQSNVRIKQKYDVAEHIEFHYEKN